jgi:hypothetical protein
MWARGSGGGRLWQRHWKHGVADVRGTADWLEKGLISGSRAYLREPPQRKRTKTNICKHTSPTARACQHRTNTNVCKHTCPTAREWQHCNTYIQYDPHRMKTPTTQNCSIGKHAFPRNNMHSVFCLYRLPLPNSNSSIKTNGGLG